MQMNLTQTDYPPASAFSPFNHIEEGEGGGADE